MASSVGGGWGEGCVRGFGGKLEGKYNLEDLVVSGSIILECMFKKWEGTNVLGLGCCG
jgi:hypothetical protein